MFNTHFTSMILRPLCIAGYTVLVALLGWIFPGHAQPSNGVTINMGVLDDLDPMATVPRLLMPSAPRLDGRIILRPPPGIEPITPQRSRVILRPPPGAPARVAAAPTLEVPPPAAAAIAPPTPVTLPPSPEPPPQPQAPLTPVRETAIAAPSPRDITEAEEPAAEPEATPEPLRELPTVEQTASLQDSDSIKNDLTPVTISFGVDQTDLPDSARNPLNAVVERMKANDALRIQLMAYASSADGSPSSVRRKSLSRALSVRQFLMDQGLQSTRIEVRALGDRSEGGEPNRVDVVVEQR